LFEKNSRREARGGARGAIPRGLGARLDLKLFRRDDQSMNLALAPEQKQFVADMVLTGRFGSESEVVNEALRRMADLDFLMPPPLTPEQIEEIYGPNPVEEEREIKFGRAAMESVRRAAQRGAEA
jgi:Arc/MetJ-type ribon-helix-helix transcriptional regulator